MGRSLEVRGKSENLPVVGCTLVWEPVSPSTKIIQAKAKIILVLDCETAALMFSRAGTHVQVRGLMLLAGILFGMNGKNRRSSHGNGGFFIGFYTLQGSKFPRVKS